MFKEKVNRQTDTQRTTGHDISSLAYGSGATKMSRVLQADNTYSDNDRDMITFEHPLPNRHR